jgi:hypothetical protein
VDDHQVLEFPPHAKLVGSVGNVFQHRADDFFDTPAAFSFLPPFRGDAKIEHL